MSEKNKQESKWLALRLKIYKSIPKWLTSPVSKIYTIIHKLLTWLCERYTSLSKCVTLKLEDYSKQIFVGVTIVFILSCVEVIWRGGWWVDFLAERDIANPPSLVERDVANPPSLMERDIANPPSPVERDVVAPPSLMERDVANPPSLMERDIANPPSSMERDVVAPPSSAERDIANPPSSMERDVVTPPSLTERDVVTPPSLTERDVTNSPSTRDNLIFLSELYISIIGILAFVILVKRTKNQDEQLETQNQTYAQTVFNDAIKNLSDSNEKVRLFSVYYFKKILKTQEDNIDEEANESILNILCQHIVVQSKKEYEECNNKEKYEISVEIKQLLNFLFTDKTRSYFNGMSTNLVGAHLGGAYFGGVNLDRALLNSANLKEANLRKTNLHKANLERANLKEANLREANLKEANLERAHLAGANLTGADLRESNLIRTNLRGASLRGAHFYQTHMDEATIDEDNYKSYFKDHYGSPKDNKSEIKRGEDGAYYDNIDGQKVVCIVLGRSLSRINSQIALKIYNTGHAPAKQLTLQQFIKMSEEKLNSIN